tara:strand:- start:1084 stop:1320 length:237 start_codon:yes stop_codon:yes gene_type:complete
MLGTILYGVLDIGLNATLWIGKVTIQGIYSGYQYFTGYEEESKEEITNSALFRKMDTQSECINTLRMEFLELRSKIDK